MTTNTYASRAEVTRYRILSSDMIHTPGMLRFCIDGYRIECQRKAMMNTATALCNGVPIEIVRGVLSGDIQWQEVDGNVEIVARRPC